MWGVAPTEGREVQGNGTENKGESRDTEAGQYFL